MAMPAMAVVTAGRQLADQRLARHAVEEERREGEREASVTAMRHLPDSATAASIRASARSTRDPVWRSPPVPTPTPRRAGAP